MAVYRDEGVVLRTQRLGEADRIITLLTRANGRVRCVARGVRKTTSRIGARLEPFSHVDVQLYEGRSLDSVTQVETIEALGGELATDYARWTAATVMVETAERLTPEEKEPALSHYALLVNALRSMAAAEHDSSLTLDAYLLRSMAIAGWSPSFGDCARCGAPGPHRAFHIGAGGMVCSTCRPPGSAAPSPEAVQLLGALLSADWEQAEASEERARKESSGIVAAYTQWHLERGLRSMPFVQRETMTP